MRYNLLTYIIKEEQKMIEVTTEENREEHERLLDEFVVEQAKLDCLLYFFSRERDNFIKERDDFIKDRDNFIKEHDEQEERIRDLGEEWLKIHEQICELYRIYGANESNFRSDFKIIFEKAISDVKDESNDEAFFLSSL